MRPAIDWLASHETGVLSRLSYEQRYLKDIGLACFDGHELTGICKSARLNVVDVTLLQRQRVSDAYSWYVVEETGIDGRVIWQTPTGDIYQTAPGTKTRKVFGSLAEYIIGYC